MEANDRRTIAVSMVLALLAIFLVDEFAPQYLIPLIVIFITFPFMFFAGVFWEKSRFDAYLDYLREVGDLVDNRQEQERESKAQEQPIRGVPAPGQPIRFNRLGTIQQRRQKLN